MSDKMHTKARPKDQKDDNKGPKDSKEKSSRFAEGRLKLSTSCTECHRRKQKCDQKQPCRHCARRFPPPKCVYPLKDALEAGTLSTSSGPSSSEPQRARPPLAKVDTNKSGGKAGAFSSVFSIKDVSQDDEKNSKVLSKDSFDVWGPSEYQDLLTSMVDNITENFQATKLSDSDIPDSRSWQRGELIPYSRDKSRNPTWVSRPSSFSITSVDPLHFLGVTPTYESAELLQAFLKVITKYVVSIDGSSKPNYYNDVWVPWCMKSPLLAYLGIYSASCYQSETQKIPPTQSAVVLKYKLKSIGLLNKMLSNKETATCTEAITAVIYLVNSEWYWSSYDTVQAHMKGLKEMVRLRGGLGELGHDGFLRRLVILVDYHIACSFDVPLAFPHNISSYVSYPVSMSTPFLYSLVNFTSIAQDLKIALETALILDDMRFLNMALLRLLNGSQNEEELQKLSTTSHWAQNRVLAMPEGTEPNSSLSKDFVYKSTRIAALIYCRAIISRITLAEACTYRDLNMLWASMWRVPLTRWQHIPGIFTWIILASNQAAQATPHGRFLKSMFKASTSYMALDHFEVMDAAMMTYVRLQRWLREDSVTIVQIPDVLPPPMEFHHVYDM